jgi:hypothetical protein
MLFAKAGLHGTVRLRVGTLRMMGIACAEYLLGYASNFLAGKPHALDPEDPCGVDEAVADALARVVEGEILPRLRLLHRPSDRARSAKRQPTAAGKEHLHALLFAPGPVDLNAEVAALLGSDIALETVLLDLLVPAARYLGTLWEEDLCDFLAVTEGLGRLQALTHRVCFGLE